MLEFATIIACGGDAKTPWRGQATTGARRANTSGSSHCQDRILWRPGCSCRTRPDAGSRNGHARSSRSAEKSRPYRSSGWRGTREMQIPSPISTHSRP